MNNVHFAATADDTGKRLDIWLKDKLEKYSRSYIEKLIAAGKVTIGGKTVKTGYRLKAGDIIEAGIPEPVVLEAGAEEIPLDILYEDDDIIVVNKPRGMVVHPGPGLFRNAGKCTVKPLRGFAVRYKRDNKARHSSPYRQVYFGNTGSCKK